MLESFGNATEIFSGTSKITRAVIDGREVHFLSTHLNDVIQQEHQAGRFYEPDELKIIARHTAPGMSFCDVGANVGNHAIFFGLFLKAANIICFEPNPKVIPALLANILLNHLDTVCDTSHLGLGLGDQNAEDASLSFRPRNTGASRLSGGGGSIRVRTGDSVLAGRKVDFLKIDVEGMELEVLRGFEGTLERHHPTIFVEVENDNLSDVEDFLSARNYRRVDEWRRYRQNTNLLFEPQGIRQ